MYVMDQYELSSDPCDYCLIQCTNALQCLACICRCLALCCDMLKELACIIEIIADCVYFSVTGCMTAQTAYEVEYRAELAEQNEQLGRKPAAPKQNVVEAQPVGATTSNANPLV